MLSPGESPPSQWVVAASPEVTAAVMDAEREQGEWKHQNNKIIWRRLISYAFLTVLTRS